MAVVNLSVEGVGGWKMLYLRGDGGGGGGADK